MPLNLAIAGSLEFKTRLGYDYYSQTFQVDSLTVDTLDAVITLGSTYIDNLKGQFNIEYAPIDNGSMLLMSSVEQSAKDSRVRLAGDFKFDLFGWRFNSDQEFDWRQSLEDSVAPGRSYWLLQSRNRLKRSLSPQVELRAELNAEIVRFDSIGLYNKDFSRISGRLGLSRTFGQFSTIGFNIFATSRNVPDSTAWNYLNSGLEGSLAWMHNNGELDLYLRAEKKDYEQLDQADDYDRLEGRLYSRLINGNSLLFRQMIDFERVTFAADDELNFDYTKLKVSLLAGLQSISASVSVGPVVEWLNDGDSSQDEQVIGSQDYTEFGLLLQGDYLALGRGFVSVESEFGHRALTGAYQAESDFYYERIDLLLDANLIGDLRFNTLLSIDWEFHEISTENNRSFLISSGISYSF